MNWTIEGSNSNIPHRAAGARNICMMYRPTWATQRKFCQSANDVITSLTNMDLARPEWNFARRMRVTSANPRAAGARNICVGFADVMLHLGPSNRAYMYLFNNRLPYWNIFSIDGPTEIGNFFNMIATCHIIFIYILSWIYNTINNILDTIYPSYRWPHCDQKWYIQLGERGTRNTPQVSEK
jgi:hypothetical protein